MDQERETARASLRSLVEKWLSPTDSEPVRVTRFSRTPSGHRRFVCVEALRSVGSIELAFFRHDDGAWHIFPPSHSGITMRTY
ncbi:hypothetical protein DIE00_02995 [Burkholderia sp. Bp8989]|nr:hypothetical protein [Burkholderia sp. IMCC1007]RQS26827.1 hypothetical protein DIE05_20355 [Burkholderia sp. Bp8995]RQS51713.1 hypothetical protein DIE00_02995 [Burkholderia sp. Bp8989]